ncbi:MAG TPA: ABC transporter ATP-binding protein [Anaerolineaceae bacterium]|nr:ABC transporter ATP-binding protein [Anaerolineaceae bacterium]
MTQKDIILETHNLTRYFGGLAAVDDVSIQIERNTLHAIIGPNGAGKTTLFNLISGVLKPTSGNVVYKGQDLIKLPVHRMIHMGLGRSFQITNIFPNLSAFENVRLAAQSMRGDNFKILRDPSKIEGCDDRSWDVLKQVGLFEKAMVPGRFLSHGDQRKLELGMILAPDPELLLLDEPTAGMAGEEVPELIDLIRAVQAEGSKTVLLVEHNMNVVMENADVITVMNHGKVLAGGKPAEIANNQEVQTAYLGGLYEIDVA